MSGLDATFGVTFDQLRTAVQQREGWTRETQSRLAELLGDETWQGPCPIQDRGCCRASKGKSPRDTVEVLMSCDACNPDLPQHLKVEQGSSNTFWDPRVIGLTGSGGSIAAQALAAAADRFDLQGLRIRGRTPWRTRRPPPTNSAADDRVVPLSPQKSSPSAATGTRPVNSSSASQLSPLRWRRLRR